MIHAIRKEKTEKRLIKIPDRLMADIDAKAIGFYGNRSEFITEAIRSFTRDRLRKDREEILELQKTMDGTDLMNAAYDHSQISIKRLKSILVQYRSEEYTGVTIYLPYTLLDYIESCFISEEGELRNLQEFARLAAAHELDKLVKELSIADMLDISNAYPSVTEEDTEAPQPE